MVFSLASNRTGLEVGFDSDSDVYSKAVPSDRNILLAKRSLAAIHSKPAPGNPSESVGQFGPSRLSSVCSVYMEPVSYNDVDNHLTLWQHPEANTEF